MYGQNTGCPVGWRYEGVQVRNMRVGEVEGRLAEVGSKVVERKSWKYLGTFVDISDKLVFLRLPSCKGRY